jgi:CRP/FNR family transcriptional regulator, nitrogen oxide reductase regulator
MSADDGKVTLLATCALFRTLDRRDLQAILAEAATCAVEGGVPLLNQGDEAEHLFVVTHGRFKMTSVEQDGAQITLRFMEPGDVIGCAAVFRRFPYPATATAVVNSTALSWTALQFAGLLRRYPEVAANALALVGGRADDMLQRLRGSTTQNVEQRLARALLRLVEQGSSQAPPDVGLKLSRQDLAELTDTTVFTVSRIMSDWTRANIIAGGRGRIVVRDLERLTQIAENGVSATALR